MMHHVPGILPIVQYTKLQLFLFIIVPGYSKLYTFLLKSVLVTVFPNKG